MNLLGSTETKERVFRIPIRLTPKQLEIDASPARHKIVRAGRKFGKTTYSHKKALDWLAKPNSVHWQISPTYKSGKLISWEEFKRIIPQEALKKKPNDTDLIITLKNGSQLFLMGSDEPDTLRGPAPTSVTFEEAALHKREVWHEVIRPNLLPHKAPALFISTPKGFNWFKDLEDQARLHIEQGGTEWAVFHFTSYDNPHLDRFEIEKDRMECGDERVWRQEYMAEYESSVGRVFSNFSEVKHVGDVKYISGSNAGRAIDWGMRDDTGALWGYTLGNILHVYREHAENNLPPSAQARMILNKTQSVEKIERNIISHDAAKLDSEMKGLSVLWHFQNAGMRPLKPSSRNKSASRALLSQLFREDRIRIDRSCVKLRRQLLSYEWKDTVMENTVDVNVDLVDALHYLAELFQMELSVPARMEDTLEERRKQDALERAKMHRFKIPSDRDKEPSYDWSNTPAGYL